MHGELLGVDRVLMELVEQSPGRLRPTVAGHPQDQVLVVARPAGQDVRRPLEVGDVGEPEPDMAPGHLALELVWSALRDQPAYPDELSAPSLTQN